MEQEKMRRRWILVGAAVLAVAILFYQFVLGSTRVPVETLRSSPLVESRLLSTTLGGDVILPVEFTRYEWRGSSDFSELEKELKAKGMRLVDDGLGDRFWAGNELEISFHRSPTPEVQCWRALDSGVLTQFRMWLLERKSEFQY